MKELEGIIQEEKDKLEVVAQQQKEYRYVGSMKLHRGHMIFMVNKKTWEIEVYKPEYIAYVDLKGNPHKRLKVSAVDGYFYITALNMKNARKKVDAIRRGEYKPIKQK